MDGDKNAEADNNVNNGDGPNKRTTRSQANMGTTPENSGNQQNMQR